MERLEIDARIPFALEYYTPSPNGFSADTSGKIVFTDPSVFARRMGSI